MLPHARALAARGLGVLLFDWPGHGERWRLDHRVRATVLEGAFGDEDEETRAAFARGGWVAEWAAALADRGAGVDVLDLRPVDLVSRIAPRPMLFVTGDKDRVVPPALSARLYAAARPPKALSVIHGANHGEYGKRDATYYGRLSDFFDRTLVP